MLRKNLHLFPTLRWNFPTAMLLILAVLPVFHSDVTLEPTRRQSQREHDLTGQCTIFCVNGMEVRN